jgi:hypothetical protein
MDAVGVVCWDCWDEATWANAKPKRTNTDLIWGSPALKCDSLNRAVFGLDDFN